MNKFFKTTFDFFSYAIPGSAIIIALVFCDTSLQKPLDIIPKYAEIIVEEGLQFTLALLVAGYLVGFLVYPIGRRLYRLVGANIAWIVLCWPNKTYDPGAVVAKRFTLVRELSPVNFAYIEKWHMHAALSHGLALAGLVGTGVGIYRKCCTVSPAPLEQEGWGWFIAISLLITYLGIERAVTFAEWAQNDLKETISKYGLNERAKDGLSIPPTVGNSAPATDATEGA